MPHPNLVPVSPKTSRSTQSSGISGGTSTSRRSPLTMSVITNITPSRGARAGRVPTMSRDWPASTRVTRSNSGSADHCPLHSSLSEKMLYDENIFSVYPRGSREGAVISRWNFGEGGTIGRRNRSRALVGAIEEFRHDKRIAHRNPGRSRWSCPVAAVRESRCDNHQRRRLFCIEGPCAGLQSASNDGVAARGTLIGESVRRCRSAYDVHA